MSGETVAALVVAVGRRACALALTDVSEVMRPLPIERVDGAPFFVAGLAVVRGAAVPVVDLGAVLEGGAPSHLWGRFVSVKVGARHVALAVGGVLGVRTLERAQLTALPPLLRDAAGEAIEAIAAADAQLLVVLRAARLVPEELWSTLAADRGAS